MVSFQSSQAGLTCPVGYRSYPDARWPSHFSVPDVPPQPCTLHGKLATDIDWILNQGRSLGIRAHLKQKLDYIWRSCTGKLLAQNDMFRLTYAMELVMEYDWVCLAAVSSVTPLAR